VQFHDVHQFELQQRFGRRWRRVHVVDAHLVERAPLGLAGQRLHEGRRLGDEEAEQHG
jgi:hypothetical protein